MLDGYHRQQRERQQRQENRLRLVIVVQIGEAWEYVEPASRKIRRFQT